MATYLVTGVNRGIGFGFLKAIAANPNNFLIGTVRNAEAAKEIEKLGYENVKLLYLDITLNDAAFKETFKDLEALTPNGIDVIIHNIGVGVSPQYAFSTLESLPGDEYDQVYKVNVSGPGRLYRTIYPRLETNGKPVKLVFLSSSVGCIEGMQMSTGTYGASKAALNHLVKQISIQRQANKDIVIPINPGLVDTDMTSTIRHLDFAKKVMITKEDSVRQMLQVIDNLTFEDTGKFFNYDGTVLPY